MHAYNSYRINILQISARYDILLIQEIRDKAGQAIKELQQLIQRYVLHDIHLLHLHDIVERLFLNFNLTASEHNSSGTDMYANFHAFFLNSTLARTLSKMVRSYTCINFVFPNIKV